MTIATEFVCTGVIIVGGVVPITVCRKQFFEVIAEERRDRDDLDMVSEE
jgi:poly(A) polymerase Pap1